MNGRALNIAGLALVGIVGIAFLVLTPRFAELDTVLELTVYMIMAILALSLALIWGYGGILCFGQSAFFGLGAYTYAIAMFNIGESTIPLLLAIILPAALRRTARLFHVLWPDQRRLSRRHHADGDADPVQFGQFHGGSRVSYRRGTARRLQRHSGNSVAECPRQDGLADRSRGHVLSGNGVAARDLFRIAAAAGQPFRPHHRRHPGKRAPRRTARLRSPRLQACHLHHRRRAGRLCRLSVRQLGKLCQPDDLRAGPIGADHHLGHCRRARHADRPDRRLHRHPVAQHRAGGEPAQRQFGLVGEDIRQCAAGARDHPGCVRAAGAEGAGADARRLGPIAAGVRVAGAPRRPWSPNAAEEG